MVEPQQENRTKPRRRMLKTGHISFHGGGAKIDCVIRNLSERGACLKVESPVGIPDTFDLLVDRARARNCRVTWRKATQIGVEFSEALSA